MGGTIRCLDGKKDFFTVSGFVRGLEEGGQNKVVKYKINNPKCKEFGTGIVIRSNLKPSISKRETDKRHIEAILSKAMSDAKIAPKIHGVIIKPGAIYSYAMDEMDGDLVDLFEMSSSKENDKRAIELKLKSLFQRMAKMDLYCIDVKLGNAVYKKAQGTTDIRLIDFDPSWCEKIEVLIKLNPTLLKDFRNRSDRVRLVSNVMMFIFLVNSERLRLSLGLKSPFFGSYFAKMGMDDINAIGLLLNVMKSRGSRTLDPIYIMKHYHKKPLIGSQVIDYLNFLKKLKRSTNVNTQSPNRKNTRKR